MYHHFRTSAAVLAAQLAHLRKTYALVSMAQVASWLASGAAMPENACAVTIDDGYRDFFEVAYPLFREFGIPATVYLVTEFLDGKLWLWTDQVRYAFRKTPLEKASLEMPNGTAFHFELGSAAKRVTASNRLAEALKQFPNADRLAFMGCLPRVLKVSVPEIAPAEYAPLTWDQIRAVGPLVEFGSNSATHPILSRMACPCELEVEIGGSKRRLEDQLDRPVVHFCYPNGKKRDISTATIEVVRLAGFRTAVTAEPGLNCSKEDSLYLRRIGVEPELEERYFQRCAAGFRV